MYIKLYVDDYQQETFKFYFLSDIYLKITETWKWNDEKRLFMLMLSLSTLPSVSLQWRFPPLLFLPAWFSAQNNCNTPTVLVCQCVFVLRLTESCALLNVSVWSETLWKAETDLWTNRIKTRMWKSWFLCNWTCNRRCWEKRLLRRFWLMDGNDHHHCDQAVRLHCLHSFVGVNSVK